MLGTERPKVTRRDRLDYQCTLVDLILSVLASGGEPSLSTMAIVVEDGITESRPYSETELVRLCSVSLHLAKTVSDKTLLSPYRTSLCQERVDTLHSRISILLRFLHKITIEHTVSLRKFDLGSSTNPLYAFDPKIERTLRRLRKARNLVVNNSRGSDSVTISNHFVASSNNFAEPGKMKNNDRILKELAAPNVVYQPWCIQYPQLERAQTYELKSGLIHLLPKFHGLAGEDPYKHLKEFDVVCSTMRP
ncbi:hypothetical protein CR513_43274, partial [Mucuna pruriens]